MAIRNIIKEGNPLLREKCKEVTEFDDKLGELIDDMIDTMFKANGVGLAAPQIAILKRIAVVSVDGETIYEMIKLSVNSSKIAFSSFVLSSRILSYLSTFS